MESWRKVAIALTVLAMIAWTAFIIAFLSLLKTPAIEGAAEATELLRIAIVGIWLAGLGVGAVTVLALWRRTFDAMPPQNRVRWALAAYAVGIAIVLATYWFEIAWLLVFGWLPLAAALLILTAWAASPEMRRRLDLAIAAWATGVALVGTAWWFAPRAVGVFLWIALGAVTVACAAWWAVPLVRSRVR